MHRTVDLKVHYYGTPVVLLSTRNPDGTANLAPMSSAWWLGQTAVLGLGNSGHTTANLLREREVVVNLVPSTLADAVDRLAMTTGSEHVPAGKAAKGYRFEPDKFGVAGLTPQESGLIAPPRVAECPIQLECVLQQAHTIGVPEPSCTTFVVDVVRAHVAEELIIPGTEYVDPVGWDPLIMKFCEFFGGGRNLRPSALAEGWNMPHERSVPAPAKV
ncbi:flavin reductase family protein [Phytomonospora sp. NPDC050363]|uniref:flavin reductase family protein n=1 Tax=Phytomonospora sp. NPDC050363 TaxID=3155642 RepID=UPI0033C140EA